MSLEPLRGSARSLREVTSSCTVLEVHGEDGRLVSDCNFFASWLEVD